MQRQLAAGLPIPLLLLAWRLAADMHATPATRSMHRSYFFLRKKHKISVFVNKIFKIYVGEQSRPGEQTLIKQAYARGVSLSFCLMDLDVGVTRCHTNGCLADDDRASSRSHSHGQLPDFDSNLFVAVLFFPP